MRLGLAACFGALIALCACSHGGRVEHAHAAAPPQPFVAAAPPVAPVRPVSDTYFGTTIVDPYRWMESSSPELDAWMKGQAEHTSRALAALPLRAALRERVQSLAHGDAELQWAERRGSSLFYLRLKTTKLATAGARPNRSRPLSLPMYMRSCSRSWELRAPACKATLQLVWPVLMSATHSRHT